MPTVPLSSSAIPSPKGPALPRPDSSYLLMAAAELDKAGRLVEKLPTPSQTQEAGD